MQKKQWEIDTKDRFLRFLLDTYQHIYAATDENVIVNPVTGRDYDYELTPQRPDFPVIALEIFRLVGEQQEIRDHATWGDLTGRLEQELQKHGIAGYGVRTPHFNVPKFRRHQFVAEVAEQIASCIKANPHQEELKVGGYIIRKIEGTPKIVFSHIGSVRAINPYGTSRKALDDLLPTKNQQLDTRGRLRILLIVNANMFAEVGTIHHYFSTIDFEQFPNVDRVFFESAPNIFVLVFDRRVFDCYSEETVPREEELQPQFYTFLEHRLCSRDAKAFEITKKVVERSGNLNLLSNQGKDALISCGEKFVQEGEWPSVLWIIQQLKNDADPPFPNELHNQLAREEECRAITSIRGRLCWLIQKVIVHNRIVALCEAACRRHLQLPDRSRFMNERMAEQIKQTAFRMLREAGDNPPLLDAVSNVIQWIRDVSEEEAAEVTERLGPVRELSGKHSRCGLLLYFALFRENDFQDLPRFNSQRFKELLHRDLGDGNSRFRTSLMWQMAGGAEDKSFPYEKVWPFVQSFIQGPYGRGFLHLRRICEAHIKEHAAAVCTVVNKEASFLAIAFLPVYFSGGPVRGWGRLSSAEFYSSLTRHRTSKP